MAKKYTFSLNTEPKLAAKHVAFPYQREASEFVAAREYSAVFHEQGLGKTKIAIDAALTWLHNREIDTLLVFTKKSLVDNWCNEFAEHTYFKPSVLSENSSSNYYVLTSAVRAIIAHYEVAKKEEKRLAIWLRTRRVAVVLDEAVKIKNPDADLTKAFFRLSPLFARRIIMTGTPSANRPFDIWAPVYFLDGGKSLGTDFAEFKRRTDLPKKHLGEAEPDIAQYAAVLSEVHEKLAPISVRETKAGGKIILPDKEFDDIPCMWEPTQLELYRQVREQLRAVVMRDGVLVNEEQDAILKRLLRLLQITSHPFLIDESYTLEPGKFQPLYDLLSDIVKRGEKAIVFTQFNEVSRWLKRQLAPFGSLLINGKIAMHDRTEAVRWFKENPEDRVLVATTGAAKEGLTLTVANHVIFYDRGYSLDEYLQSQDRIHRVSQTRKCYVHNLIIPGSIDDWISALIEQKKYAAQVAQGDMQPEEYVSRADFSFEEILRGILEQ